MKFGQWLGLAAIIAAVALLWNLRGLLLQLFAAVVLALAICTLVGAVRERLGCPRPLALVISLVGLALVVVVGSAVLIPPFVEQFAELLAKLPDAADVLIGLARRVLSNVSRILYGRHDGSLEWLQQLWPSEGPSPEVVAGGLGGGALRLLGLASNLGSGTLQFVFVIAVSLMLAVQPTAYRGVLVLLAPSFYRRRFGRVLDLCGAALSSWMVGVVISSLFVALLAGVGLSLLGVKLVVANALLAGLLNVIPNVGPTLSTVFPMSVALLDAPWKALAVLGLYVVVQNLESYVITPSVMHAKVHLLPGLTLTAQFLFTIVFGPLGLLLALPMAVCVQVIVREVIIHDILDPWKRQRLSP